MNLEKYTVKACCGRTSLIYKTDCSLTKSHIESLSNYGFTEKEHFTKSGILYVENTEFIITGPLGQNRLTVKCKIKDCTSKVNELENKLALI